MRSALLLLVIVTAFGSLPVEAQFRQPQDKPDLAVYFDGGLTNPVGPDEFNESWNIGYNYGTGVAIRLNQRLMVRPRLSFNSFSLNGDAIADSVEAAPSVLEDGKYSTLGVSGELLVELEYNPFPIKPFFIIGGGYFRGDVDNLDGLEEEVDLGVRGIGDGRIAVRGGVGVRTALNDYLSAFAEAKIVTGFTGGFGVMYAPVSLGAMFRF